MSRMVLPSMEERGRGAVINMGSASMVNPLPLMASYAASKAYVSYLSEALVSENATLELEVGQFQFLNDPDCDSLAIFGTLRGIGTGIGVKGIV